MDDYDARFDRRKRRARRFENEADDAWGAAEEDGLAEPDLDIEDLAAGYEWNDPDPLLQEPPRRRRTDSRPYIPPTPGGSYDPARGYPTQGPIAEPPFDPFRPPSKPVRAVDPDAVPPPQPHSLRAYCSILVLVILALMAFGALVLAFAVVRGAIG